MDAGAGPEELPGWAEWAVIPALAPYAPPPNFPEERPKAARARPAQPPAVPQLDIERALAAQGVPQVTLRARRARRVPAPPPAPPRARAAAARLDRAGSTRGARSFQPGPRQSAARRRVHARPRACSTSQASRAPRGAPSPATRARCAASNPPPLSFETGDA